MMFVFCVFCLVVFVFYMYEHVVFVGVVVRALSLSWVVAVI